MISVRNVCVATALFVFTLVSTTGCNTTEKRASQITPQSIKADPSRIPPDILKKMQGGTIPPPKIPANIPKK
jgi:hypothetical protein